MVGLPSKENVYGPSVVISFSHALCGSADGSLLAGMGFHAEAREPGRPLAFGSVLEKFEADLVAIKIDVAGHL
jgi:hypothetical protein